MELVTLYLLSSQVPPKTQLQQKMLVGVKTLETFAEASLFLPSGLERPHRPSQVTLK